MKNRQTILSSLLLLIAFWGLFSACRKTSQNGGNTESQAQFAIYTVGFKENNGDRGIAIITLVEKNNKLDVESSFFTFNSKSDSLSKALSGKFIQNLIHAPIADSTYAADTALLSKNKTVGTFATAFFSGQPNFKSSGKLSDEQIKKLVGGKTFKLVSSKTQEQKNILIAFLNSLTPSAYAQTSGAEALGGSLFSVLAGIVGAGAVGLPSTLTHDAIYTAAGTGIDGVFSHVTGDAVSTTGLAVNAASGFVISAASPIAGTGFALTFGINQMTQAMQDAWITKVLEALGGTSSTNNNPKDYQSLWASLIDKVNQYIKDRQMTNKLSVSTGGASSITASSAILSGENTSSSSDASKFVRLIAYSTNSNVSFSDKKAYASVNGAGQYSVFVSGLSANTTYYYRAYTGFQMYYPEPYFYPANPGAVKSFKTADCENQIGDAKFGGIIFYLKPGDCKHGYVCSATDVGGEVLSGPNAIGIVGGLSTSIGKGAANTDLLVGFATAATPIQFYAALAARNYGAGWFLPSKDELNELYKAKGKISNLSGTYWSSSMVPDLPIWAQNFDNGSQFSQYANGSTKFKVRAVREF